MTAYKKQAQIGAQSESQRGTGQFSTPHGGEASMTLEYDFE
jgi:hypothetical protein